MSATESDWSVVLGWLHAHLGDVVWASIRWRDARAEGEDSGITYAPNGRADIDLIGVLEHVSGRAGLSVEFHETSVNVVFTDGNQVSFNRRSLRYAYVERDDEGRVCLHVSFGAVPTVCIPFWIVFTVLPEAHDDDVEALAPAEPVAAP